MDKRIFYKKPGDALGTAPIPCAKIQLQGLLDKTAERLCLSLTRNINTCTASERKQLEIQYKWGCSGSKILFNDFFVTVIVPLKLTAGMKSLWTNPIPNEAAYCRPIQVRFSQISDDISADLQIVKDQIPKLQRSEIKECQVIVKHVVPLEMASDLPISQKTEEAQWHREKYEKETNEFTWKDLQIDQIKKLQRSEIKECQVIVKHVVPMENSQNTEEAQWYREELEKETKEFCRMANITAKNI